MLSHKQWCRTQVKCDGRGCIKCERAYNAALKSIESRPTVRRKAPVQQAKGATDKPDDWEPDFVDVYGE